ncbi:uncharacterized protein DSM5745_10516 [Aspergillus mulundensis]|uniref:Major facilitator superfamily (MFS) profile domain-containing protein n=1 Tax=Aspergillus mulundensis TaxID=1810919 RepID=A0A3D8QK82_9EURO|nr:hypothetical protein DSM5745_10516 [Aspergillus mulundensis]RDW61844.1 hypothetical protein DSM5745_10516 [Aspergillus mulundensis]
MDKPTDKQPRKYALVVFAGFSVMLTTCAFIVSYGVYRSLYKQWTEAKGTPFTGSSTALINLVDILAIALMSTGGPFAMHWSKIYLPQAVVITGGWVFVIAYILSGFGKALWHFALAQGVILGIRTCLAYVPTLVSIAGYAVPVSQSSTSKFGSRRKASDEEAAGSKRPWSTTAPHAQNDSSRNV